MRPITLTGNIAGNTGLVAVLTIIQSSGAEENTKLWATLGVAALMVGLSIAAQFGPHPQKSKDDDSR